MIFLVVITLEIILLLLFIQFIKKRKLKWMISLLIVLFVFPLLIYLYLVKIKTPFTAVSFIRDSPGATGRIITFTPVLQDNPNVIIGPTVGADYGCLRFSDVDGDNIKEAIIETDVPFWSTGEYYLWSRHILKYDIDKSTKLPKFILVESVYDENQTLEEYRLNN